MPLCYRTNVTSETPRPIPKAVTPDRYEPGDGLDYRPPVLHFRRSRPPISGATLLPLIESPETQLYVRSVRTGVKNMTATKKAKAKKTTVAKTNGAAQRFCPPTALPIGTFLIAQRSTSTLPSVRSYCSSNILTFCTLISAAI
jgi:hypothetical protein